MRRAERGFSLLEAMLAMAIVLLVLLSVAQLFAVGAAVNRAAEDITQVTTLASDKLEELKIVDYDDLDPGGSLDADVAGYFDLPDVEGDGETDYTRRWMITDLGDRSLIEVRVVGEFAPTGNVKESVVGALRARP